ncbi:D-inositol-3-phosphate glycosyltransferase [mine drainage metagenome]|uniref:D-inositol-3-phosphate glycosyltransferase n=1 Tax=mine drainage metagenome TaxID=410659 RepID=A0A1J5RCW0_9ZZZZ
MRILIHGINFVPELTGIGKYTGEMAQWLAARGHQVKVVTAPPYYPQWRVGDGYSGRRWSRECRTFAGGGRIEVIRCPLWVPRVPGGMRRLLHLASFVLASLPVMLAQIAWRPDLVWVVEPALLCAPQAWITARAAGARAWLHVQDFEVDAAFELGLLRGERSRRAVLRVERWLLARFDSVSTISPRMVERLLAKGVAPQRATLFPNWVDLDRITPQPTAAQGGVNAWRVRLGLGSQHIVALYSGNMGAKQGIEVLSGVARRLAAYRDIVLVLCGEGAARASLESKCAGLGNVRFLDLQPLGELNELLNMADMHLLPQRADAADLVMPSKLTGMLASGRPVIAAARAGTALGDAVRDCGIVVEPEQPQAMAAAIAALAIDAPRRHALGVAARLLAEGSLGRDAVLVPVERAMYALCMAQEPRP